LEGLFWIWLECQPVHAGKLEDRRLIETLGQHQRILNWLVIIIAKGTSVDGIQGDHKKEDQYQTIGEEEYWYILKVTYIKV